MQPTELHLQSEDTEASLGIVTPKQHQSNFVVEAPNTYLGLKTF
jgi:hypothetical protein